MLPHLQLQAGCARHPEVRQRLTAAATSRAHPVAKAMRYLVIIPPHQASQQATHRQLETGRKLEEGDQVVLDEVFLRVDTIIDGPRERGLDATLICMEDGSNASAPR